jgi:hypothetical protein
MEIKNLGKFNEIRAEVHKPEKPKEQAPPLPQDKVELGKSDDTQAIKPHAKWLFLNYIAADCNLTQYQMKNVDQMELVGSDKNTHIVTYIDVGPKANPMDGKWQNCRCYYITKDNDTTKINSEMIKDFGRVDMSNPETLKKFIIDAMQKFPADHVALILNDHGGGFTGAMADDSDGNFMSVPQIKQALSEAEKVTGKKIDIVGFDACLMAETEVAYELKDNAKILLASEESEGGPGWTYNSMLGGKNLGEAIKIAQAEMKKKIDVSPEDFAKIIVQVNQEHNKDIPTFSATDLTKIDTLTKAVNDLAKIIKTTSDKEVVKQAIGKAENYGGGWSPYGDIRDLHGMCTNIAKNASDKKLAEAAKAVVASVEAAVFANEVDPSQHPESHGLSIYAPTSEPGYNYKDLAFAKDTEWDEALKSLGKGASESEATPKFWPDGSPRKAKE